MKFTINRKKKVEKKFPLSNFELYLLRETLPFINSYGEVDFSSARRQLFESLSCSDQKKFESAYEVAAEANIILFLKDNGYLLFNDNYGYSLHKEPDCPIGFTQIMLKSREMMLTDKGRALKYGAEYEGKTKSKTFTLNFRFNKQIFKLKYILPFKEWVKEKVKRVNRSKRG